MSDFIGSATHRIAPQDYIQNDHTKNVVQEESRNVQSVLTLAKEQGGLSMMLDKQSLRTDDSRAMSAATKSKDGNVEGEAAIKTVKVSAAGEGETNKVELAGSAAGEKPAQMTITRSDNKSAEKRNEGDVEREPATKGVKLSEAGAGDSNKAERLAGAAASIMPAQTNITQPNNKSSESKSAVDSAGSNSASSVGQARSQPAVEGGTDITAPDATRPLFINVLGDMKLVALSNQLTVTLSKAEAEANKAAARSTTRVVEAAERAGDKGIAAEQKRMNGAITSGVIGMVAQGATTATSMKALNKESKSINTNLGDARKMDLGLRQNQTTIKNSSDNMLSKGKPLDNKVEKTLTQPHAETMHDSAVLTDKHANIQIATQKTRITAEYVNQAIRSGQGVIQGTFDVEAAKESKQADLARADQTVNSEVGNTQQQTAKKAADTKASLHQVFETTMNNNSSAASAVADRMR